MQTAAGGRFVIFVQTTHMRFLVFSISILLTLSLISFTCYSRGYTIKGSVSGLRDSTWLYLRCGKPDTLIDSCRILNGTFQFTGSISDTAIPVYLHTASYSDMIAFWLENSAMDITLQAGSFRTGKISGSLTQQAIDELSKQVIAIRSQKDSIHKDNKLPEKNSEQQEMELYKAWVRSHPRSPVSVSLLSAYGKHWGIDTTKALFENISPEIQHTVFGKEVSTYLSLARNLAIGSKYEDFEQSNTQDKPIKLSQVKARYILLDFWASWCIPCRHENIGLKRTYDAYKNKGFAILGVSLDNNKKDWLEAIQKDELAWENVCDLKGFQNQVALMYNVDAIPTNFLIDEKGIIIAKKLRGKALEDKLKELLP